MYALNASFLAVKTRRPGSAWPRLFFPRSAQSPIFTFISPLSFFILMTRVHIKLLDPCVKTAPESTQAIASPTDNSSLSQDQVHRLLIAELAAGLTHIHSKK